LPDRDLAWLVEGSDLFNDYVEAIGWAQDYAKANVSRGEVIRPAHVPAKTLRTAVFI
jgi:hypothetical protein